MSETLVWAFQPLPELNNETGFVACEQGLAEKLLAADKVQNPNIGAHHFREITASPAEPAADVEYSTKVMAAKKRKSASEAD